MIPQRNISVLSNRLASDGSQRIPEGALERDYCMAWFLAMLSQTPLKRIFAFKGGTVLKRCYFGDYRFSEDLDFTLLQPTPLEEILQRLETLYEAIHQASGIRFRFDRLDRHGHVNSHTFYLNSPKLGQGRHNNRRNHYGPVRRSPSVEVLSRVHRPARRTSNHRIFSRRDCDRENGCASGRSENRTERPL
jgi:hypothetical protein